MKKCQILHGEHGWNWIVQLEGGYITRSVEPLPSLQMAVDRMTALIQEWERMFVEAAKRRSYQGLLHSNDC